MNDPRLGRNIRFDERSRGYDVRALTTRTTPRSYTWRVGHWFDQLLTPRCVGYSILHELVARPVALDLTEDVAHRIYETAVANDIWPGDPGGTSVLEGMKAARALGLIKEYRWGFSHNDSATAVSRHGPAVVGTWWWTGMFTPDSDGYVHATGQREGGHAYLWNQVQVRHGYDAFHNSWGPRWGDHGRFRMRSEEFAELLADDGEVCIPTVRR